ncbi:MAG: sulfotransferase domain-containing protein [Vallitaleaceae bacterium]|nr:sulfotransferase domain-containing protein [Vallitaleaceae bacterium]
MKFPEFVIIGAPKCGTTALWYNIDKHPKISMATKTKSSVEIHFWGSRQWKKGFDWYKRLFEDGKMCGEKSVEYWSTTRSMRLMKQHIPNTKFILCIRNPVDRAYSNFQMNARTNKSLEFTFPIFKSRYANQGYYFKHIKNNVLKFFDKDQLHICIQERMKNNITEEMKKVFDFLEVEDLNYKGKEIEPILTATRTRMEDVSLSRSEKTYRIWSRYKGLPPCKLRNDLLEYYKPFNDKLFKFLGYEIKEWNR